MTCPNCSRPHGCRCEKLRSEMTEHRRTTRTRAGYAAALFLLASGLAVTGWLPALITGAVLLVAGGVLTCSAAKHRERAEAIEYKLNAIYRSGLRVRAMDLDG